MTSKTPNAKAQREYKARQRAAGFDLIAVWVPRESRALVQRIAALLCETAQQRRAKEGETTEK